MRKLFLYACGLLFAACISSCATEPDYKEIRSEVVTVHDKVMADGDVTFRQRTLLDSLLGTGNLGDKAQNSVKSTIAEIDQANHQMEHWMNNFEPDVSHIKGAPATYFTGELQKVKALDSLFRKVMVQSDHLLDSLKL
ncbi:hypothetical protein ACJVDH_10645 [Pedobacter sp. AW1-32]|uniref:hypothetical protein n=1 Tax=Pedobacter sp. AW1-32 TaxID=3383026 RepID=UPI003FED5A22